MRRWVAPAIIGVAVVSVAVVLLFVPLTEADQSRVIVVATVAAAIAAVGSTVAAFASLTSARESADVARSARRAMVLHNRPTFWFRTWCRFDTPPTAEWMDAVLQRIDPAGTVMGESPADFDDSTVKAEFHIRGLSGVTAARFSYVTPGGQQPPVSVSLDELVRLPGVVPAIPEERWLVPVTISRWTLECRDLETRTLWRAQGVADGEGLISVDNLTGGMSFEPVDE